MQPTPIETITAIEEFTALALLVQKRLSLAPEEAADCQPEFERELREHTLKLERAIHTVDFERMDTDVPGIIVDGKRYARRRGKTVGHYTTLAGPIEVLRTVYRQRGGHGGPSVAALELRLGLINGHWTSTAAEVATTFMAFCPSNQAETLLKAAGTMSPSSSHLDRVTKHVGAAWEAGRVKFEAEIREAERLDLPSPEHVRHIVFSLDGIMVPMKDAPRTPGLGKLDQGPKGHKEASCATVVLYSGLGERLRTIQFGRMPEAHKRVLHQQLVDELRPLVIQYPEAELVAVADGAHENWRIIAEIAETLGCPVIQRLDFFHAVQHLIEGLRAGGLSDDEIKVWRGRLKQEPDIAQPLIEELAGQFFVTQHSVVEKCLNYFSNNAERVDYAEAEKAVQPIGSGIQEAACKTLVAQRMKQSGMSWRTPGGEAVLTLRGLAQSNRLGIAWSALRPTLPVSFEVDSNTGPKRPERPDMEAA